MKINTATWQWFDFKKIFVIKKGFYNKKPETSGLGTIPFLGATDNSNGVTDYYTLEEIQTSSRTGYEPNEPIERKIFPAHAVCVTNNGSVGYAYYQKTQFTCSHDVNPLYLRSGKFNEYTGLFIAAVIMHDRYRWGYGRKWRPERMNKSRLKLPIIINPDGTPKLDPQKIYSDEGYMPDWQWMENYIKSLKFKLITTDNKKETLLVDCSEWREFKLGDLFDRIYKAEAHIKAEYEVFDYPLTNTIKFISRTEKNNGCDCYIVNNDLSGIEEGHAIVIGDTTATCSYQNAPFICGDHIVICRGEWVNAYTGIFVASIIKREKYKYNYGRAYTMSLISETYVKLPIMLDSDGTPKLDPYKRYSQKGFIPDWQWIEHYIRTLPFGDRI